MLCKDMNLKFEFREVLVMKGETMTPDFLSKNPQHSIPTLEHNGKYLCESHAIMTYLVSKFGDEEQQQRLYSRNVYKRAVIDHRLLFDTGVLFPCFRHAVVSNSTKYSKTKSHPFHFQTSVFNNVPISKQQMEATDTALSFLETFLKNQPYVCGDHYTVADMCLSTTILSIKIFYDFDRQKYPMIDLWMDRMTALPYFWEVNRVGNQGLTELLQTKIQQIGG